MVMHKNVPYIRCRDGIYYFVRRVPDDVKSYYSSDRISMSLRTKSNGVAIRATKSICQRLDDYWIVKIYQIRLKNYKVIKIWILKISLLV